MAWLPVRALLKRPGLSALAVTALGLGIGLTTTMFSIVNGVILRGLPFRGADRIVVVGGFDRKRPEPPRPGRVSMPDYLDIRTAQGSFEDLAASVPDEAADLMGADGIPLRYESARVTPNVFALLGAAPLSGRVFNEADARPGAEKVVLIAESIWNAQFDSDPRIVGRVIHVGGDATTIVGVMPASFGFPEHQHVWLPLTVGVGVKTDGLEVVGRLRDRTTLAAANAELTAVAASLAAARPENKDTGLMAQGYIERKVPSRTAATFWTMLAAVFGVLLIACVNVANLQLARAADRTRDVAIRLALGAGRGRIIRGLLVEGLILSVAGALLGLAIARAGLALVWRGIADPTTPFWIRFDIDLRVLGFTTLLTAFAAVASSIVPALRATRGKPNDVLKDEGRGATSLRVGRFSRALVVTQVALSFGLLMGSGLVIKSIMNTALQSIPFRTDLLTGRVDLSAPDFEDEARVRVKLERIRQQVAAVPGVTSVTFASNVPGLSMSDIEVEGQPDPPARSEILAVAPDYLEVLGMRVTTGRGIEAADRGGAELVAVVTDDFAARYFPGQSPIGRRFRIGRNVKTPAPWRTIVGTAPSMGNPAGTDRPHDAAALVPLAQRPSQRVEVVVAVATGADAPIAAVRRAIAQVDQALVVDRLTTMKVRYDERTWPIRVFGGLFSAFGVTAMLLASAGLYGVMAFAVRRRTAEIGIRMALGADRWRILRMVMRQGLVLLGSGVAIGAGLGLLLATQLTQLLFRVQPWDGAVVLTTFVVLVGAGVAASLVPARRAAAVDPLVALGTE
jgi:putative ABC transport system permease protein